jgi:predicted transcriptional regulator
MDWDAGPVARPYTVTGGRTRPRDEAHFDLIDVVARTGMPPNAPSVASPERRRILQLCSNAVTVADLASAIGLPLGVVRVLLADLVHEGLIEVARPATRGPMKDQHLLRQVLDGLNAL